MASEANAVENRIGVWPIEPLGALGKWVGGGTPSKAEPAFWTNGTIPWVSAKDMKVPVISETADLITEDAVKRSTAKRIPPGSVLCVMRSGILAHTFPVAVTAVEVTVNQDLRALVVRSDVDPRYLAHFLHFAGSDILLSCSKHGTTVSSIEASRLDRYPVPLPPIEAQHRIVARIDELFSDLDDGEAELARASLDLEIYRKALLNAAVTGELTADWRSNSLSDHETGADWLTRIIAERRAASLAHVGRRGHRNGEVGEPEGELQFDLPEGWACGAVGQVGEVVTGGTPPTSRSDFYGGDVPFFTPGDLETERVTVTKRTLTASGLASVRPVPEESILVTCIGATIGKLATAGVAGATNQQINAVVPSAPVIGRWVYAYLASPLGQQEIVGRSSSTTLPILNKGDFMRLPIPLPPEPEVVQIIGLLAALSADSDAAADDLVALKADCAALRQSILTAAFRGELVQ